MIRAIGVVVPAHDEEALLPACLAALRRAAGHPALADPRAPRRGARSLLGPQRRLAAEQLRSGDALVERRGGNVGAARRAGIAPAPGRRGATR